MVDKEGVVIPKVGDVIEFQAVGTYKLRGSGEVRAIQQVQDFDGRLVTVYMLWSEGVADQPPGWILVGEGERVLRKSQEMVVN
jgi:hypothetical protein